jgi:hypothetical protein
MVVSGHQCLTVVNIVQTLMRIIRVFNNESPAQAIAVLVMEMTVIPKCSLQQCQYELVNSSLVCKEREVPLGPKP